MMMRRRRSERIALSNICCSVVRSSAPKVAPITRPSGIALGHHFRQQRVWISPPGAHDAGSAGAAPRRCRALAPSASPNFSRNGEREQRVERLADQLRQLQPEALGQHASLAVWQRPSVPTRATRNGTRASTDGARRRRPGARKPPRLSAACTNAPSPHAAAARPASRWPARRRPAWRRSSWAADAGGFSPTSTAARQQVRRPARSATAMRK